MRLSQRQYHAKQQQFSQYRGLQLSNRQPLGKHSPRPIHTSTEGTPDIRQVHSFAQTLSCCHVPHFWLVPQVHHQTHQSQPLLWSTTHKSSSVTDKGTQAFKLRNSCQPFVYVDSGVTDHRLSRNASCQQFPVSVFATNSTLPIKAAKSESSTTGSTAA